MQVCCPCCSAEYPIEAGFSDADGKRLAALFAELEPELGRAAIGYLRLFKPVKNVLRAARAAKLLQALIELVHAGSVCRDERGGVRRPATSALWSAGIEQMLQGRAKLTLPLDSHNYLRAIVFGLADKADAAVERKTEAEKRVGNHRPSEPEKLDPLREKSAWLRQQLYYGAITQSEYDAQILEARREVKKT